MTLDRMKEEKQRKRARRKQAIADRKLAAEQEETARQAAQIEDAAREEKKAERRKKKQEELEASIKDHQAASPTAAAAPAVGAPLASPPRLLPELGSTAGSGMLSGALSPVMTTMSGPFDMNASLRSDTSSMLDSSKDALVRPCPLGLPPKGYFCACVNLAVAEPFRWLCRTISRLVCRRSWGRRSCRSSARSPCRRWRGQRRSPKCERRSSYCGFVPRNSNAQHCFPVYSCTKMHGASPAHLPASPSASPSARPSGALKRESSLAPTADLAAQARSLLCEAECSNVPS